jgi:hypothetical protein
MQLHCPENRNARVPGITDLASLVLSDLVLCVLAATLALAIGLSGLGNVDLW